MPWRVWLLWLVFLARGSFYCVLLPLWEGWDEYAHFAYVQHASETWALPGFDTKVSREIDESMRLAPLPYELRWIGPPYLTLAQWFALPAAERDSRARALAALPPEWARQPAEHPFVFYEAQQPPLYYWLMAIPLRLAASWHLWPRVLLLRLLSMAISSTAIPLTWAASRSVWAAALLAAAPGFAIDTARVANDSLAIALAALLLWLVMRRAHGVLVGMVLAAGLTTKAYFLGLLLAVVLCGGWQAAGMAVLLSGWWDVRNALLGLSPAGWQDQTSPAQMLRAAVAVNWFDAASVTAKSFFWFGAWSFLTLKSWIYTLANVTGLVALVLALRKRAELRAPLIFLVCVAAEMAVGVLSYQATHGIGSIPGWYGWVAGGALAIVVAAGLGRWSALLTLGLAAIDIYGAAGLMAPYYAGVVERGRVHMMWPGVSFPLVPWPLTVLWILATLAGPAVAFWSSPEPPRDAIS
jgi:hypothetical protein